MFIRRADQWTQCYYIEHCELMKEFVLKDAPSSFLWLLVGNNWRLWWKMNMWSCTADNRRILKAAKHLQQLTKVQRQIFLSSTGAFRSTAPESLATILRLPPLFEYWKYLASQTVFLLKMIGQGSLMVIGRFAKIWFLIKNKIWLIIILSHNIFLKGNYTQNRQTFKIPN